MQSGQERSGIDLQLSLMPAVRVSGSVTGPTGPIANATVRLLAASPDVVSGLDDGDVATAVTGPDGTFMMMGVAPGQYIARVERQGRSGLSGAAAKNPLMQMFAGGTSAGAPATPLYGQVGVGRAERRPRRLTRARRRRARLGPCRLRWRQSRLQANS